MAKVRIKRKLELLTIDDDRARSLKNRWLGINGASKAEVTELLDLGSWAGNYGQIDGVEIETERKVDEWEKTVSKVYSDVELESFHKEMQRYRTTKIDPAGREFDSYATEDYLVDRGAVSWKDYLGKPTRFAVETDGKFPLAVYDNKLDHWHRWRERKSYGRRMRDRELIAQAEVVAGMSVEYPGL